MAPTVSKHLRNGAECPPLKSGQMRLYSMTYCPFVHRICLILSYFNVPYETVNINLKDKPDWFWHKNADGTVPVLEFDGKLISESVICAEYLDEVYGNKQFLSTDPYEKARQRILLQRFGKFIGVYWILITSKKKEDLKDVDEKIKQSLEPFESGLQGKYFGGEVPDLLDFLIWPWFERLSVVKKLQNIDVLNLGGGRFFPKLRAWVNDMEKLPAVKDCRVSDDRHFEFIRQNFDPNTPIPDYDM